MKKILSVAVASLLFISCKHKGHQELVVPKNASTIVHINGASITSKANWNALLQTGWFRQQKENTNNADKQLLEHPEQSGIDLKSDFIYFTQQQDFITYSVFEGKLKSLTDFEKLIKEKNAAKKVEEGDGFNFLQTGNSDIVTWNDSKFICITTDRLMGKKQTAASIDGLKSFAQSLYNFDSKNSIETNEKYTGLLKEPGDIHFWSNSAQALSNLDIGPIPVIAASPLIQGSITAGTINFENGMISIKSNQFLNATLSQIIGGHTAKRLSSDLLNHVSPDATVVIAMNYPPQVIKEFLQASGTEKTAGEFLTDLNFSVDELVNATKGELLITASQLGPKKISLENMDEDELPLGGNVLIATSVNNDSSVKKLGALLKYQFPRITTKVENNWFLAGSSSNAVSQFFSSNSNTGANKLSGHPFGMYLDFQKAMQQWSATEEDSSLLQQIQLAKSIWQDMIITGGEFKNNSLQFEINIDLVDKSANSLQQLEKYFMQMQTLSKNDEYAAKRFRKSYLAINPQ